MSLRSSYALRSSYKNSAVLKKLASGIIVCSSINQVEEFKSVLRRERSRTHDVTILLLDLVKVDRVAPIRELVGFLTALDCLALTFPLDSISTYRRSRSILPSITFSKLTTFSSNLPHAALASFLAHQPQLRSLTLGPCGSSCICPLGACTSFANLTSVKCEDFECVLQMRASASSLASIQVVALDVESPEPLTNVRALRFSASGSDAQVVRRLTGLVPNVELLAIIEHSPSSAELDSQPALALSVSLAAWAEDFLRLPCLYKVQVQLQGRFGSCLDNDGPEVRRWLARCSRHMTLRRVSLWTESSNAAHGGRLRTWVRRDSNWEPVLDQQGGYLEEHHVLD
ncbi:hypothetical protein PENSPDRAFT_691188 [Peniophora sp. CONT]|nr:hypothetical protein PENSPDRAFT_691188 [Peniophora sp. CONT]